MKINLDTIDHEQFVVHQHLLNGEVMWLVQPCHIGAKWTQTNKHFRSSLWNNDGELVSAGFPKFPNLGESPNTFPVPTDLRNATIVNKLDGSLLIVSKYKGNYILRTRGTVDATKFENGLELELFKKNILPKLEMDDAGDTWNHSFLFEWLTAMTDKMIVLKYANVPDWILIGVICHTDYLLWPQVDLDNFATHRELQRPEKFKFNTVDELVTQVTDWKNVEGIVLYTKSDQCLHKVKSDDYKKKHAFKSNATLENTLDLFISFGYPAFNDFQKKIGELYDWECVQMCIGHMSSICNGYKEVLKIIAHMKSFVEPLKTLPRRDAALKIIGAYGETNRKSFCFNLLDSKELDDQAIKKLIFQCLKHST